MKLNPIKKYLIGKAIIRGIFAAFIGSFCFTVSESIMLIIFNGLENLGDFLPQFIKFSFLGGIIISMPFTIFGANALVFDLHKTMMKTALKKTGAFLNGAGTGLILGMGIFIFITVAYLLRGDWRMTLIHGMLGITLCTLIGGITALGLWKDILAMPPKE